MPCTITAPCGGVLRDDTEFNAAMAAAGIPRRRRSCLNGHSFKKILRPGRPRRGEDQQFRCRVCRRQFRRYLTASKKPPTTCSTRCRIAAAAESLRKATDAEVRTAGMLYRTNHSIPAIAYRLGFGRSTVQDMLARAGVPRRRYTSTSRCIEGDCTAAPWKTRNGAGYLGGRRCHPHELEHRRALRKSHRGRRRAGSLAA